ncbi:hypothetical protein COB64_02255 [Candidatus Wolfebacteria bacterium]|nr:MAG: hypothetical protein COB64_02255 [Candidatus Wolfebacteria bacterium]
MEEIPSIKKNRERPAYFGELSKDTKQQLADLGWSKETQIDISPGYAEMIIEDQQVFNKEWYELMEEWGNALERLDDVAPRERKMVEIITYNLNNETLKEAIFRIEKYVNEHKNTLSPEAVFFLSMAIQVKKKALKN